MAHLQNHLTLCMLGNLTLCMLGNLTLCMLDNFASFFVECGFFFFFFFFLKINFFKKKSFRNIIRVSNSVDPDQA